MSVNIFFSRDSEYDEFEAVCKGYRCDVYVSVDDKMYHLNIYTPQRLCQDFETETSECGFYTSESNLEPVHIGIHARLFVKFCR